MTRLQLVRHGKAAAGWHENHDPGLDDTGRAQALAVCSALAERDPVALVSSPLRRARETARSLETAWATDADVDPRVGEIPSPTSDLVARGEWLASVMRGTWADTDVNLQTWRSSLIEALLGAPGDGVVFTHFVAINVAVGAALGDGRVFVFTPENCSVTTLDVIDGRLVLVSRGDEATTTVG